jgi:hypothetical protein
MENSRTVAWSRVTSTEIFIAGSASVMLLAAQWALSSAIHGTKYYGFDGKMAQATVLAALKYAGPFQVTTLSPIEGVGSQLLPMNVWANPAYWPFAFFDREVATDVSALVALGIFMTAIFIMARWFDERLDMKIDMRMAHLAGDRLFPGWSEAVAKLREAGVVFGLLKEAGPKAPSQAPGASEPELRQ